LDDGTIRVNSDGLADGADLEADFKRELIVDAECEVAYLGGGEALVLHGDRVVAGRQLRDLEEADAAGRRLFSYPLAALDDLHARRRHDGIVLVNDRAAQARGRWQRTSRRVAGEQRGLL